VKIILAIDDLKSGAAPIEAVLALAPPKGSEVLVLHVVEPPSILIGREMRSRHPELKALWRENEEAAEANVKRATQRLRTKGIAARPVVKEGDPKSRIIDLAVEQKADLIVLGSHGRKGVSRYLMGSVSEAVARYAPCSVEIARIRSAG
jgi:nucleotide-binding universal stress UspA family protein